MRKNKSVITIVLLLIIVVLIKIYSANAVSVEHNYATKIYPSISIVFRKIFGWLPFSFGDILYGTAAFALLWLFINAIKALIKKNITTNSFFYYLKKIVLIGLIANIIFNVFWGINYNRQGISTQLNLQKDSVQYADLKKVTFLIIEKMNTTKMYLINNKIAYPTNAKLFKKTADAYKKVATLYPFLTYKNVSLKPSMWGWMGNYTGFTGYYNPFTGEAQVNTTVPKFLQPFVACHEVAHQLGYAKEDEANSVGYLAAINSGDSLLIYSAYFDLYNYIKMPLFMQSLMLKDTGVIKQVSATLLPQVKNDIKEMYSFYGKHKNFIEPMIRKGYNFYLKNNNQPKGLSSYDDVIGFVVAYYKKFGTI